MIKETKEAVEILLIGLAWMFILNAVFLLASSVVVWGNPIQLLWTTIAGRTMWLIFNILCIIGLIVCNTIGEEDEG